jgi:ribosome-binding factor A
MKGIRHDRIQEQIHHLAAQFVRDESSSASLLTITRVELNPSGKDAKIYFTTIPNEQEDTALKFLERKTGEFKIYVRDNTRIGLIPHLSFHIDYGERNRQRLDELTG